VLDNASAILKEARLVHLPIIYVVVRFRDGYPEVQSAEQAFCRPEKSRGVCANGQRPGPRSNAGGASACRHRGHQTPVGAFSHDRSGIDSARQQHQHAGPCSAFPPSGVVLSTVRWAADMDYQLVVVSDASADMDDEVHRVLTEKVFPWQATVVSTHEFVKALAAKPAQGGNR